MASHRILLPSRDGASIGSLPALRQTERCTSSPILPLHATVQNCDGERRNRTRSDSRLNCVHAPPHSRPAPSNEARRQAVRIVSPLQPEGVPRQQSRYQREFSRQHSQRSELGIPGSELGSYRSELGSYRSELRVHGSELGSCRSQLRSHRCHVPRRKDNSSALRPFRAQASTGQLQSLAATWTVVGRELGAVANGKGAQWNAMSLDDAASNGPSCMFVGPLEAADQTTLEEFYQQAKDSYYSGKPLILDDMFDRVEVHLRWLRSPVVQKYPRCSLQSCTTYSDAEDDPSQLAALYGVWGFLFSLGVALAAGPIALSAHLAWDQFTSEDAQLGIAAMPHPVLTTTWFMLCAISGGLGLALLSSAWSSLLNLKSGEVIALRGICPSCTEDVYAFVKLDGRNKRPRQKTECHVCGQRLVFHAILRPKPTPTTNQSTRSGPAAAVHDSLKWAYGRVYAVAKADDLQPSK